MLCCILQNFVSQPVDRHTSLNPPRRPLHGWIKTSKLCPTAKMVDSGELSVGNSSVTCIADLKSSGAFSWLISWLSKFILIFLLGDMIPLQELGDTLWFHYVCMSFNAKAEHLLASAILYHVQICSVGGLGFFVPFYFSYLLLWHLLEFMCLIIGLDSSVGTVLLYYSLFWFTVHYQWMTNTWNTTRNLLSQNVICSGCRCMVLHCYNTHCIIRRFMCLFLLLTVYPILWKYLWSHGALEV